MQQLYLWCAQCWSLVFMLVVGFVAFRQLSGIDREIAQRQKLLELHMALADLLGDATKANELDSDDASDALRRLTAALQRDASLAETQQSVAYLVHLLDADSPRRARLQRLLAT